MFYILDLTIKWAYIWLPEAWSNGVDCVRCMIAHWRWFVWLWENLEWIILHSRVKVWKIFCCNKRWRQKRCHFSLVLRDLFLSKTSYFLFCNVSNRILYNWSYTKYKNYDNFYWLSCLYPYSYEIASNLKIKLKQIIKCFEYLLPF